MANQIRTRQIHTDLTSSPDRRMQSKIGMPLKSAWILSITIALMMVLSLGHQAAAQTKPDFGPNVYIVDPSMSSSTIETTLTSLANEPQFSTNRYAVLFM